MSLTGRRLSHYDVIEEISRGGMGVVYRALDVNLAREVALKVLPDDLLADPGRRARLLQEARAASALEHPNIAVIHEVGEADGGVTFIAMELIRGEKLSDTLGRGPLAPLRALSLATEIAEGLARAHDKGIVHRDVKPSNVMVTDDGHAKVIDFGLAKLVESAGDDAATASVHAPRTDHGVVLGTAAYMSPEQARGAAVDRRSDIFAFGVTVYEMVTGRPAFQGQSSLDTMQAVLTQPVPPLPALGGSSAEATADLQRIIGKCTAKDPDDRYQGLKDVIVDLRAARRRLESGQTAVAATPNGPTQPMARTSRSRTGMLGAAALLVAIVAAAFLWWRRPDAPAAPARSGKPAVAVLYFDNNTGDASLDWMRVGLTDMIVTDLSQSVDIEVLGTDRLVQILQQLKRADDKVISAEVIEEIAQRAGVDQVVVGSYVKAGDTIRISARLQDARTGRIVSAERVEGAGEKSLFTLVDELTRRFKSTMATLGGARKALLRAPGDAKPETLDRGLTDVTTASIEAYRQYAEGINFLERGQPLRAIPLLEQAIALDTNFAMAYAKLSVASGNLQLLDQRDAHAKRAIALASRLTDRERYYIQGYFLGTRSDTAAQSIESYQHLLKLHPEHHAARHNLGVQFLYLERYQEGVEQYEELLRRGSTNATTHNNHMELLIRSGNVVRARTLAAEFVRVHPESAVGFQALGVALSADGQFDDARRAFERGEALDPANSNIPLSRRALALLQERWDEADAINAILARRPSPFVRFASANGAASVALARGRGAAALLDFGRAADLDGLPASFRAVARTRQARLLSQQGKPASALAQAARAASEAPSTDFEALHCMAIAQTALGRHAEADKIVADMDARAQNLPTERERRRVHWARGEIALERGDAPRAVSEFAKAVATLPARGVAIAPPSPYSELLLSAAVANIKAGRDGDAAALLERLQSGQERVFRMDAYARSFFLLAQIHERRGDAAAARAHYTRFLDFWRGGDLEPEWVAEAAKKVAAR